MEGRLFTLPRDGVHRTSLFLMGTAPRCLLVVGSQTESLLTTPYVRELADGLRASWSVAQVELGSSRVGYAAPDLEADADDVNAALALLTGTCRMSEVVLYASGTGMQVALEALTSASHARVVSRVVMHGGVAAPQHAVSSRFFTPDMTEERAAQADALVAEGRGDAVKAMESYYDLSVTPARVKHRTSGGARALSVQEAVWLPVLSGTEKVCRAALACIAVPTLFLFATEASYSAAAREALPAVQRAAQRAIGLTEDDVQVMLLPSTIDEHRRVLSGGAAVATKTVKEFLARADTLRETRQMQAQAEAAEMERRKRIELAKALYA